MAPIKMPNKRRGADEAMLGRRHVELAGDQRGRHPGHEDDKALEEFAGGGEAPDAPLHRRHGRRGDGVPSAQTARSSI